MTFEMVHDDKNPGDFIVEAIDNASEGEIYTAVFTGSNAESRAREYLAWKNANACDGRAGLNAEEAASAK